MSDRWPIFLASWLRSILDDRPTDLPDDQACLTYVQHLLFPDGVTLPTTPEARATMVAQRLPEGSEVLAWRLVVEHAIVQAFPTDSATSPDHWSVPQGAACLHALGSALQHRVLEHHAPGACEAHMVKHLLRRAWLSPVLDALPITSRKGVGNVLLQPTRLLKHLRQHGIPLEPAVLALEALKACYLDSRSPLGPRWLLEHSQTPGVDPLMVCCDPAHQSIFREEPSLLLPWKTAAIQQIQHDPSLSPRQKKFLLQTTGLRRHILHTKPLIFVTTTFVCAVSLALLVTMLPTVPPHQAFVLAAFIVMLDLLFLIHFFNTLHGLVNARRWLARYQRIHAMLPTLGAEALAREITPCGAGASTPSEGLQPGTALPPAGRDAEGLAHAPPPAHVPTQV